jgi:hypothetical protein
MGKYIGTILLLFFSFISVILNFNLNDAHSQRYDNIDNDIIPLLIPPYKMINGSLNHTELQTIK